MVSDKNGIRFFNYTSHPLADILECWVGITQGSNLDCSGKIFDANGLFLPEPSSFPLAITPSAFDQQIETGAFIALIDFRSVLDDIRKIVTRVGASIHDSPANQACASTISAAVKSQIMSRSVRFLGLQENLPGLFAATINRDANIFIGLHVDSWYQSPISQRFQAPNRISINLGEEARIFLFSPVDVAHMATNFPDGPIHPTELARHYLGRLPTSRIYALKVPPGCAYVAPTENLAHDAATSAMSTTDWSATLLGQFTPLTNPQYAFHLRA